jgi:hypothetical protein
MIVFPSWLNTACKTGAVCPVRIAFSEPLSVSHTLAVLSAEPEIMVFPSGLKDTLYTGFKKIGNPVANFPGFKSYMDTIFERVSKRLFSNK